jgi:transcriptional regulator with XRE-family HTH domain
MEQNELATCLRTWRDRLTPEEVGLPRSGKRRAPGLRREEIAALAGVSVDYLARLEQGRAGNPSSSVIGSLARALRLTDDERAHLFRLVGLAGPGTTRIDRHLTPGVQRILDRLTDVPVMVIDPSWTMVAINPLAQALLGHHPHDAPRDRNVAWGLFVGDEARLERSPEERDAFRVKVAASLHEAVGLYPDDELLLTLVADLRKHSPRFAELWEQRPVAKHVGSHKTIIHPEVGRITLDCDVLKVSASDLDIVVYTAKPGSPDAAAIALLDTIGLQTFASVGD